MLGSLRKGLASIGGPRIVLATLAIAWGLNTIQKVVDEQTIRLAALAQAEQDIMNRAAEFAAFSAEPVPETKDEFPWTGGPAAGEDV